MATISDGDYSRAGGLRARRAAQSSVAMRDQRFVAGPDLLCVLQAQRLTLRTWARACVIGAYGRPVIAETLNELGKNRGPNLYRQAGLTQQPVFGDALFEQAGQMDAVDLHQTDIAGAIAIVVIHRARTIPRLYGGNGLQQFRLEIITTGHLVPAIRQCLIASHQHHQQQAPAPHVAHYLPQAEQTWMGCDGVRSAGPTGHVKRWPLP